ncbi:MAG: response regulator [Myxococcaceae bacterium]
MKARRTVMLVEDHPTLRRSLRASLHEMGFDTLEAADANSAIHQLAECAPDLVCLELVLPESNGYEVCEFIRQSPQHQKVPVLMLSGRGYPEDRAHAAEAGANGFLTKPFSEQEFRQRIQSLIDAAIQGMTDLPADRT